MAGSNVAAIESGEGKAVTPVPRATPAGPSDAPPRVRPRSSAGLAGAAAPRPPPPPADRYANLLSTVPRWRSTNCARHCAEYCAFSHGRASLAGGVGHAGFAAVWACAIRHAAAIIAQVLNREIGRIGSILPLACALAGA